MEKCFLLFLYCIFAGVMKRIFSLILLMFLCSQVMLQAQNTLNNNFGSSASGLSMGGTYQLYARQIRLDGEGVLYEKFQALKKELEEMDVFPEYKKPIPPFAMRVGVVTASTGAAVRDIMNISRRRNPYVQLILYPAQVQGEGAKESIVKGIRMLEQAGVDVMIVGRGGGSIEDLWAFNEEIVARAIFDCSVPVISAVGHETDTTIADYVADLRAPTPSAAAELAVWDIRLFDQRLQETALQMNRQMDRVLQVSRLRLQKYEARLQYLHPGNKLRERRQMLVELEDAMRRSMEQKVQRARHQLAIYIEKMRGLSPAGKLNQGYSYVERESGGRREAVKSIRQVEKDMELRIYVSDGVIRARAEDVQDEGGTPWKRE